MSLRGRTDIQLDNGNCGNTTGGDVIGYAKVQNRKHGKLQIDWRLTDGIPDTVYTVSLWNYNTCQMIATLGTVKTNGNGKAYKKFMYKLLVPVTAVFTDGFDGTNPNDSLWIQI